MIYFFSFATYKNNFGFALYDRCTHWDIGEGATPIHAKCCIIRGGSGRMPPSRKFLSTEGYIKVFLYIFKNRRLVMNGNLLCAGFIP